MTEHWTAEDDQKFRSTADRLAADVFDVEEACEWARTDYAPTVHYAVPRWAFWAAGALVAVGVVGLGWCVYGLVELATWIAGQL